jgi:hypothetical protein
MTNIKHDSFYNSVLLANIDSMSSDEQKSAFGAGMTIQGIPFNINENEARLLKTQLSQHYDFEIIYKESTSVLLMTGQEAIIKAWQDCMAQRAGLAIRFEPLDGATGKNAFVHVDYYRTSQPGNPALFPPLELTENVYIDASAAEVKSGADCLEKGMIYRALDSCTIQLAIKSAWTTMPLVFHIKSTAGRASPYAYLAPRAQMKGSTVPFSGATGRIYAFDHWVYGDWVIKDAPAGYVFLKDSIKTATQPAGAAVGTSSCQADYALDTSQTHLQYRANIIGVPYKADWYCTITISATLATVLWDPPPPG